MAGLRYPLRFERADNLGAYSIPYGDRPSHPIWLQQLGRSLCHSGVRQTLHNFTGLNRRAATLVLRIFMRLKGDVRVVASGCRDF